MYGSSSGLAAAYGIAVSGTMIITSVLILLVALARPNQRLRKAIIASVVVYFAALFAMGFRVRDFKLVTLG